MTGLKVQPPFSESQLAVDAVAKHLAVQQIDPTAANEMVWRRLDADTRRMYRDKAVGILVALDMAIENKREVKA